MDKITFTLLKNTPTGHFITAKKADVLDPIEILCTKDMAQAEAAYELLEAAQSNGQVTALFRVLLAIGYGVKEASFLIG